MNTYKCLNTASCPSAVFYVNDCHTLNILHNIYRPKQVIYMGLYHAPVPNPVARRRMLSTEPKRRDNKGKLLSFDCLVNVLATNSV